MQYKSYIIIILIGLEVIMLNREQENFIRQFVKEDVFEIEKVISYLRLHDIVGGEIFELALKEDCYASLPVNNFGYAPVEVDVFIRRIPFYFYVSKYDSDEYGNLMDIIKSIYKTNKYDIHDNIILEKVYVSLEKMFYEWGMSIRNIMHYAYEINQTRYGGEFFFIWVHFLELCDRLHIDNKYPNNFLYETNRVFELAGEEPDIYEPGEVGYNEPYVRNGNEIIIGGEFPYDENNQPILKWIGVWIENANYVKIDNSYYMSNDQLLKKILVIGLSPTTKIYLPNGFIQDKVEWYPIYFGPMAMDFDSSTFKQFRKRAKLTQQNVADAIGVQLRTYQKWEKGEVKPDGYNLIRLMNYLNIESVQEFLKNDPIIDDNNYTKFRNRINYN